jgi:hypothetical protein
MSFLSGVGHFLGGAWNAITGQTNARVAPTVERNAPTQEAMDEYIKRTRWIEQAKAGAYGPDQKKMADALRPQDMPDLEAIQQEIDRQNIAGVAGSLGQTAQQYNPLISNLQLAAAGKGPSAALDTYKAAADARNRSLMSMASSGNVAPGGGRAALLGSALQTAAQGGQEDARQAGIMRANEMNQAYGQLGQALGGQAQTESAQAGAYNPLFAESSGRVEGFANRSQQAEEANVGVAQENAHGTQRTWQTILGQGGQMAGGIGGGGKG